MWGAAVVSRDALLAQLAQHLFHHVVTLGGRAGATRFLQHRGVAQGSVVSAQLCNGYHGRLEKLLFARAPAALRAALGGGGGGGGGLRAGGGGGGGGTLLLRLIDDFLLVTADEAVARADVRRADARPQPDRGAGRARRRRRRRRRRRGRAPRRALAAREPRQDARQLRVR